MIVSSFSIFDLKKMPAANSSHLLYLREDSVDLPIKHYGTDQPTETVQGDEYTEEALIIPNSKQSG